MNLSLFVWCFSALLPSLCVFSFLFFILSHLLSLTFLILTPPPQRRDKARRQSSWAHLFVYIHLLRHKALMESNHSSPAAGICARVNVDTVPQMKTEMNLKTYWIFSRHISRICLLCPQDRVWQNISHATNTLKVLRTSWWRWTIGRTPGQNVLSIHHCFLLAARVNWKHEKRHESSCGEPGMCDS